MNTLDKLMAIEPAERQIRIFFVTGTLTEGTYDIETVDIRDRRATPPMNLRTMLFVWTLCDIVGVRGFHLEQHSLGIELEPGYEWNAATLQLVSGLVAEQAGWFDYAIVSTKQLRDRLPELFPELPAPA